MNHQTFHKDLYPNISYFIIQKEFLFLKIGDIMNIMFNDSMQYLWASDITLSYDTALKYPDYFKPISNEQHSLIFRENTIQFCMLEKKMTREKAERFFDDIFLHEIR